MNYQLMILSSKSFANTNITLQKLMREIKKL